MKPLPPYAKQFLSAPPSAGLCVAIGPTAWDYAKKKTFPVLVCPSDSEPSAYRWPGHAGGAVVFERGDFRDDRLSAMATELLAAGCPFVVAIREALMESDPRHFYYPEAT